MLGWDHGRAFGPMINYGSDDALQAIGNRELACARMREMRRRFPSETTSEPLFTHQLAMVMETPKRALGAMQRRLAVEHPLRVLLRRTVPNSSREPVSSIQGCAMQVQCKCKVTRAIGGGCRMGHAPAPGLGCFTS